MERAAKAMEFMEAARLRDELHAWKHVARKLAVSLQP